MEPLAATSSGGGPTVGEVTDEGGAPGEQDDDSPWRRDAGVSFDHPPRRSFADIRPGDRGSDGSRSTRVRSSDDAFQGSQRSVLIRRGTVAGLALVVVLVAATVVVLETTSPPSGAADVDPASLDVATTGGDVAGAGPVAADGPLSVAAQCAARWLPTSLDARWSVELAEVRRVIAPVTVGDDSVVAVVDVEPSTVGAGSGVAVVALDVDDGRERWRAVLEEPAASHEIVGIADRAVVVRSTSRVGTGSGGVGVGSRRLFAFDEDSGELLWDRGFRGDWSATMDGTSGFVYVGVRRPSVSSSEDSEVEVIDPRLGRRVHVAAGARLGLDPDGRLVTRAGDQVLATSPSDRDVLGTVVSSRSPFTVVGSQLVVAENNATDLTVSSAGGEGRRVPLVGSSQIDAPGFVVALQALGPSSLAVIGGGAVHGARITEDSVEIGWRVEGVVLESAPSDRGRSLVVATDGGAQQQVIDSSTGRTIVDVVFRPGAYGTLDLVSNGVVVQDVVDGDRQRVALDLDGRELWSLPGSGPIAVGRGLVVDVIDVDDFDAVVRIVASGSPSETVSRAECRAGGSEPATGADAVSSDGRSFDR